MNRTLISSLLSIFLISSCKNPSSTESLLQQRWSLHRAALDSIVNMDELEYEQISQGYVAGHVPETYLTFNSNGRVLKEAKDPFLANAPLQKETSRYFMKGDSLFLEQDTYYDTLIIKQLTNDSLTLWYNRGATFFYTKK